MRLLHTADWHLGRSLHGMRLLDDQAHVLTEIVQIARDSRPDAILIAGDIYDRAVPPGEAIELLDDTLSELALDLNVPIIMIAGNHDGPQLLSFGARLLATRALHIIGSLQAEVSSITLDDPDGPVTIYALPYADPPVARQRLQEPGIADHNGLVQAWAARVAALRKPGRAIAIAHAFVAGGMVSGSERELAVGGAGAVAAAHFAPFCYTALGHLHAPQTLAGGSVCYAGSPLKYSISEIDHAKGVCLVDLDADGLRHVEVALLHPKRDLRRIEGTLAELLRQPAGQPGQDDYIVARLTDAGPVLDPMYRLRQVYPNVVHLERPELANGSGDTPEPRPGLRIEDLFGEFFTAMTGGQLTDAQEAIFAEVLNAADIAEREGGYATDRA